MEGEREGEKHAHVRETLIGWLLQAQPGTWPITQA